MISIPEELLEQVERGNVLLFIGERVVRDPEDRVVVDWLTAQLAARSGIADSETPSFPQAAQAYEDEKGRHALVQYLRDHLETLGDEPQRVDHLIAGLTDCKVLITTCLSNRLQRAFEAAGRHLDLIVGGVDVAFEDEYKAKLYKLRGSLDRPDSLILTEDDHEAFFHNRANLSIVLRGYLARKTILFVGYDLADSLFKRLYFEVTTPLDDYARRAYAFGETPSSRVRQWCKRHGIDVVESDATTFLEALTTQLEARARPTATVAHQSLTGSNVPLLGPPYKLLDYYEMGDAAIFFAREQETQKLGALIHGHRLVLLHGASGTGKTSLLLAGVINLLKEADPPYEAIYVRSLEDPAVSIRRALRRLLPEVNLPQEGSLLDLLDLATTALGRTLLIILDQFEEFFIRLSPQFRRTFIAQLGEVCDARDVPLKVVLSLREDWLASVGEIETRIPEVFLTRMRLLPLTRGQARHAVTAPVEQRGIRYEPALVEHLLDDLAGSEGETVMPPQLQLVCSALYDGLEPGQQQITLANYQQLGGTRGVLREYLDGQLNRLQADERGLARDALEELITSQGTKAVKAAGELALALNISPSNLEPVLEKLVRARLLRVLEGEEGRVAYELAHEYLIQKIGIDAEAQIRKQAEELLRQEVENWHRFGTVLDADKLALVGEVRDMLRLSDETQEFLLHSAIQTAEDIEYWLKRIGDPERRVAVLARTAASKSTIVRQRAAEALALQDIPQAVEPLLELAVHETDQRVRATARTSLSKLNGQRASAITRLQSEVESTDTARRRVALEALAMLPIRDLPQRLQVPALAARSRLQAVWLVERSIATSARRAIIITAGLLVALITLAYLFSASSYYVDSRSSVILNLPNELVVRQGHPWLPLPGLGRETVKTGISAADVDGNLWVDVENKLWWGFWLQRSDRGYRRWGEQISTALRPEARTQTLWYLDQQEGLNALLELSSLDEPETQRWVAQALGVIGELHPEARTRQVTEVLHGFLKSQDKELRYEAAYALWRMEAVDSQVASLIADALLTQIIQSRLPFEGEDRLDRGTYILEKVIKTYPETFDQVARTLRSQVSKARPSFYEEEAWRRLLPQIVTASAGDDPHVTDAYLNLLRNPDSWVRDNAAGVLRQMMISSPAVAQESVLDALIKLLTDENQDSRVRAGTADLLILAVSANQSLADRDLRDTLTRLLDARDQDSEVRASAASILARMVKLNPELADQEAAAQLSTLLVDDNESRDLRASAASALGELVASNPKLANRGLADLLINVVTSQREVGDVRSAALDALGSVLRAEPALAQQDVVGMLTGILSDDKEDDFVRYRAAHALTELKAPNQDTSILNGLMNSVDKDSDVVDVLLSALQMYLADQEPADDYTLEWMMELATNQDGDVREIAVSMLNQAITARPVLADSSMIQLLANLMVNENESDSVRLMAAWTVLTALTPSNADQGTVDQVLEFLTDKDTTWVESGIDPHSNLISLLKDNPSLASPQIAGTLVDLLSDKSWELRWFAAQILGAMASANPGAAAQSREALQKRLIDEDADVREAAVEALSWSYYASYALQPDIVDELLHKLTNPIDPLERPIAARVLFLIVLNNAENSQPIRNRLDVLSHDHEPLSRIWANTALEMVTLADLVHKPSGTRSEMEAIEGKLKRLGNQPLLDEPSDDLRLPFMYGFLFDESCAFFGPDVTWAAREAVSWLEKQSSTEKAAE